MKYYGIRKVKWDVMWHALYEIRGRLTWDRVSRANAMRVASGLFKEPVPKVTVSTDPTEPMTITTQHLCMKCKNEMMDEKGRS